MTAKSRARSSTPHPEKPVTLKFLAEHLNLSPATVSIVLNNSPVATSIPSVTKQRIHAAAKQFAYRPNLHARMLRSRITNTIGVIVPELSEGYVTGVMLGVEQYLLQEGFLSFTVSHLGQPDLREEYQELLMRRRVDGLLLINTDLSANIHLPVVGISTHTKSAGVTNIVLDHLAAARMALRHLYDLGHRRIAFMKGQRYSLDSEVRWGTIVGIANEIGIEVNPELCIFLEENIWTPQLGYPPVCDLLALTRDFTALFCFNDTAAIGAIRAIQDAGLSCPHDISVIGFDDIIVAEYLNPRLTTVRQPLHKMGWAAAQLLVRRINAPDEPYPQDLSFEPELIVRESTKRVSRTSAPRSTRSKH